MKRRIIGTCPVHYTKLGKHMRTIALMSTLLPYRPNASRLIGDWERTITALTEVVDERYIDHAGLHTTMNDDAKAVHAELKASCCENAARTFIQSANAIAVLSPVFYAMDGTVLELIDDMAAVGMVSQAAVDRVKINLAALERAENESSSVPTACDTVANYNQMFYISTY